MSASASTPSSINLAAKLALFADHWHPRIVAEINDYQVKVVKLLGDFVWHRHTDTDELFLCLSGDLVIELRDGSVRLGAGELFVVPKGVEHRPRAEAECEVLLIEPIGVVNTGDAPGERTAHAEWI